MIPARLRVEIARIIAKLASLGSSTWKRLGLAASLWSRPGLSGDNPQPPYDPAHRAVPSSCGNDVSPLMSTLNWTGTGLTHVGMVRSENQDAFAVDDHAGVWVVADGMGGHAGGRIASQLAVRSILDHVQSWEPLPSGTGDRETIVALLVKAVSAGCRAIVERTTLEPELQGMGTTVVGVAACRGGEPAAAVAHVGDSRAYLIRSGQIRPLTVDHSMVEQLVRAGQITREEARRHPQQNVLLKALGLGYDSLPDTQIVPLQTEDLLLLCTDGITKTLLDHEILSIVMESADEPREACQRLIDLANARGGSDNATVLLISFRKRI